MFEAAGFDRAMHPAFPFRGRSPPPSPRARSSPSATGRVHGAHPIDFVALVVERVVRNIVGAEVVHTSASARSASGAELHDPAVAVIDLDLADVGFGGPLFALRPVTQALQVMSARRSGRPCVPGSRAGQADLPIKKIIAVPVHHLLDHRSFQHEHFDPDPVLFADLVDQFVGSLLRLPAGVDRKTRTAGSIRQAMSIRAQLSAGKLNDRESEPQFFDRRRISLPCRRGLDSGLAASSSSMAELVCASIAAPLRPRLSGFRKKFAARFKRSLVMKAELEPMCNIKSVQIVDYFPFVR